MKRVVIIHPDLGIGGAERLIVDLAVALQQTGNYSVSMVTAHHDKNHCFEETRDGTLSVQCVGDWLPRSIFGYFYALCAYIRMIYAALYVVIFGNFSQDLDLIVCDQISACIPFMKLFTYAKIIFYCHFPDQLLTDRKTSLKRFYRAPLDWLEEKSTGLADVILVNSKFTGEVFRDTFKSLGRINPTVLYPSNLSEKDYSDESVNVLEQLQIDIHTFQHIFLSINRYERKKNIALAIESLALLKNSSVWNSVYLIIAGGYDQRVIENKEYHAELEALAKRLEVDNHVTFVKSCSDVEKQHLLKSCSCLIYTPDREHFGIVPIEAMQVGKPVIAVNSGGPKETVLDGKTGFLCQPNKEDFSLAMQKIIDNPALALEMGSNAKKHVKDNFSFEAFRNKLSTIVEDVLKPTEKLDDKKAKVD